MKRHAGSIVERKNHLGTARAFRKAFASGTKKVALVLKARNTDNLYSDLDRDHWRQVTEIIAGELAACNAGIFGHGSELVLRRRKAHRASEKSAASREIAFQVHDSPSWGYIAAAMV
jgi:hypothetical protein